ncbi:MAG: precorrin-2 C(20)-methyltransferase [Alphaproteobacteria bacterium]|nr:precorrin-2 C(20)-methyltransferase [Alphaproteobacteria bacterium]TAD87167.1 MAG: precorrin-2 C(20)-methyltransferase [Alphaproteobacteria bacterium]
MTSQRLGCLFGLGVGPGDPELITVKAARLLAACPVVAYPAAEGGDSFARRIVADLIRPDQREIAIAVPMDVARDPAQEVYDAAARQIGSELQAGNDVALLCQGDPFFYGSFMYVFGRLAEHFPVEVVPGVSSMMACAARLGMPLAAREDVLTVVPATLPEAALEARLATTDAAAIYKLGRHVQKVRAVLRRLDLLDHARYVERATLAEERRMPLTDAPDIAPYFALALVHRRGSALG